EEVQFANRRLAHTVAIGRIGRDVVLHRPPVLARRAAQQVEHRLRPLAGQPLGLGHRSDRPFRAVPVPSCLPPCPSCPCPSPFSHPLSSSLAPSSLSPSSPRFPSCPLS